MIDFALQKKLHTAGGEMQLQVNVQIESGKFVSLYGSSGAGKTSVLRMLAGLLKPDNGHITMNNAPWFDAQQRINVEPQQTNFKAKYNLPFTLIADTDTAINKKYGVWVEKERDGQKFWGTARTTFIIDEKGVIVNKIDKVDTKQHAQQILSFEPGQ